MTNPYEPPKSADLAKGNFGEHSRLIKSGFLYREIELYNPVKAYILYNGWNFLQRIFVDDQLVWKRISWVVIHRYARFQFPASVDPHQRWGELKIQFRRGLMVRRFSMIFDGSIVYDEWN